MKTEIKDIVDAIQPAKEAHEAARATALQHLAQMQLRIGDLRTERDMLLRSPVSREDFLSAMDVVIDRYAAQGVENLRQTILADGKPGAENFQGRLRHEHLSWERVRRVQAGQARPDRHRQHSDGGVDFGFATGPLLAHSSAVEGNELCRLTPPGLCALFGPAIKEALRGNLASFTWPWPHATAGQDRERRLAAIDRDMTELEAAVAELGELLQ